MFRRAGQAVRTELLGALRSRRLFGLIFTVTLSVILAKAAQRGLFLAGSGREAIPNAFFWSAVSLAAGSLLIAVLAPRIRLGRLTAGVLAFGVFGFLALWAVVRARLPGAPLILYAGIESLTGMLLTQAWITCANAVDVREAKRVMPMLGGASALAWVLGGFGVSGLGTLLAAELLLPIASGVLLLAIELARRIGKRDLPREVRAVREPSPLRTALGSLGAIAAPGLLRLVTALAVLEQLIDLLIEYQLLAEAQARFETPEAISGFIGELYGISGLLTVIAPLLIARPVLARWGSARAIAFGPLVLAAASVAFLGSGAILAVAVLSVAERVLKVALTSPARAQIQGALGTVVRAQAGLLARGVIAPLFHAAASLALELFPADADPRHLSWVTLALCGAVIAVAVLQLQRVYVASLKDAVHRGRLDLDHSPVRVPDAQLRAELEREIGLDHGHALLALSMADTLAPVFARPLWHKAVSHGHREVRLHAIGRIAERGRPAEGPLLRARLAEEPDPAVRAALLRALHQLRSPAPPSELAPFLADPDPWVVAHARAVTALSAPDPDGALLELLRTSGPEAPIAALQALAWRPRRGTSEALIRALEALVADPREGVRHQALETALATHPRRFLPHAVRALTSRKDRAVVVELLSELSPSRAAEALQLARAAPGATAGWVATAVADIPGPGVHRALLELLTSEEPWVRYRAAWALGRRRALRGEPTPAPEVARAAVDRELALAERYRHLLELNREPFFEREVEARLRQVEVRLLMLLEAFGAPRASALLRPLRDASPHVRGRVLELLENVVDPGLARAALPFFERESPRDLDGVGPAQVIAAARALGDPHLLRCAALAFTQTMAAQEPRLYQELSPMLPQLERLRLLRSVALFADLSPEDLMKLAAVCEVVELPAGAVLFRKGDVGESLYVIAEGSVLLSDRGVELNTLHAGEHFGELGALNGEQRMADATCKTVSRLGRIAAADLEALMDRRPEVGRVLVRTLARRLRNVTEAHLASRAKATPEAG